MIFFRYIVLSLLSILLHQNAACQIYKFENPSFSLIKRISVAQEQIFKDDYRNIFWIGYCVDMPYASQTENENLNIVMAYSYEALKPSLLYAFIISESEQLNQSNYPVYWLGNASQLESLRCLYSFFSETKYKKQKMQILEIIGEHTPHILINRFLNYIIFNNYCPDLQKRSIDILGKFGDRQSLQQIIDIVTHHDDIDVLRKAIYTLSLSNSPGKLKIISALAIKSINPDVRKEAIFNLSQIHCTESLATLYEVVINDTDIDIQKFAVFSISQFPHSVANQMLIKIAQTHEEEEIKKKALYWLKNLYHQKALS